MFIFVHGNVRFRPIIDSAILIVHTQLEFVHYLLRQVRGHLGYETLSFETVHCGRKG